MFQLSGLIGLNADFIVIIKHKNNPKSGTKKLAEFAAKTESLFDISSKCAEYHIKGDRLRDDNSKDEDLTFLEDQRDPTKRKMFVDLDGRDTDYDKKVGDKMARDHGPKRMKGKDSEDMNNNEQEDQVVDDDKDVDFIPEEKNKKKSKTVTLTVSRKDLQRTLP